MSDTQKIIEDLQQQLTDKQAEVDLLTEENASLKDQVAKLLETPDELEKTGGVGEVFECDGGKYRILFPKVRVPKVGSVTAADVLADPELQAALVKSGSSVIQKLA